jgi:hypothetical protein
MEFEGVSPQEDLWEELERKGYNTNSRENVSWWVVGQYYVYGFGCLVVSCLFVAAKNAVPCRGSLVENDGKYEWGEILASTQEATVTAAPASTPTLYFHRDEMLRLGYSHAALQSLEIFVLCFLGVALFGWTSASNFFFCKTRGIVSLCFYFAVPYFLGIISNYFYIFSFYFLVKIESLIFLL